MSAKQCAPRLRTCYLPAAPGCRRVQKGQQQPANGGSSNTEQRACQQRHIDQCCTLWRRQAALLLRNAAAQLMPALRVPSRPIQTVPPQIQHYFERGSFRCPPLAVQGRCTGVGSRWCPAQGWLCPSRPAALPPPASLCGTCTRGDVLWLNCSSRVLSHLCCHETWNVPSAAENPEQLLGSACALKTGCRPVL